jgi:hypothetical protein
MIGLAQARKFRAEPGCPWPGIFEANANQTNKVKVVLSKYEQAIGQCLSPGKCSMLGNNYIELQGQEVEAILGIQTVRSEEKYLCLLVPEGRMKDGKFQLVK